MLEVQSVTNDDGDGVVTGSMTRWLRSMGYIRFVLHCRFTTTRVVKFHYCLIISEWLGNSISRSVAPPKVRLSDYTAFSGRAVATDQSLKGTVFLLTLLAQFLPHIPIIFVLIGITSYRLLCIIIQCKIQPQNEPHYIMKSISQQTHNDNLSLFDQGKSGHLTICPVGSCSSLMLSHHSCYSNIVFLVFFLHPFDCTCTTNGVNRVLVASL